jgi:hypothetical protein
LLLPAFTQQTLQIHNYVRSLSRPSKNKPMRSTRNDAAAVAANLMEDAALVTPYGRFWGHDIEQWFAELFKGIQYSSNLFTPDEDSPHILGTAGHEMWATGAWSATVKGQSGSSEVKGYWSAIYILGGDDWKIRMLCYNITPAPAATPSPTASPSINSDPPS